MKMRYGNIWSAYDVADLFLFTANSVVGYNGKLIMGAGIAKEVRDEFPGIDAAFGSAIKELKEEFGVYGLLLSKRGGKVGAIQTKINYRDPSPLHLIEYSVDMLAKIAGNYKSIHMTCPGTGNGGLTKDQVLPILAKLPDNVHVWFREET